jgi:hypothetical protein
MNPEKSRLPVRQVALDDVPAGRRVLSQDQGNTQARHARLSWQEGLRIIRRGFVLDTSGWVALPQRRSILTSGPRPTLHAAGHGKRPVRCSLAPCEARRFRSDLYALFVRGRTTVRQAELSGSDAL